MMGWRTTFPVSQSPRVLVRVSFGKFTPKISAGLSLSGMLNIIVGHFYTIPWPSSLSRSKIFREDATDGFSLTEANTTVKVCDLMCPVSPLTGLASEMCPDCGGVPYPGWVCLGELSFFGIGRLVFDADLLSPTGWYRPPLVGSREVRFLLALLGIMFLLASV